MKFYAYTNENKNYSKAITLTDIRSIKRNEGSGKSAIRFSVSITYMNDATELLDCLHDEESKKVFREIVSFLNNEK